MIEVEVEHHQPRPLVHQRLTLESMESGSVNKVRTMIDQGRLQEARQRWVREASTSDLGLWWIADDVRELISETSEEEIISQTINAIRPLMESGLLRAGKLLTDGKFEKWPGGVDEQLTRIRSQWHALDHQPTIGDVAWFVGKR